MMKKNWICFLLLVVIYSGLCSQNRFSYRDYLPIYSIANDTLEKIIDDFLIVQRENKERNIAFFYVGYYPDSTYDVILYLTEKTLLYDHRSLYKHPKCQQFIIKHKNCFIPAYLERYPRDINRAKDISTIEIPFLHQTTENLRLLMQEAPKGYYDNTYLGEGILEKWIISRSYEYKDGNFSKHFEFLKERVP